jgi:hypothetical protein
MKLNLSIASDLEKNWRPLIEHQFNLTLAPLAASLLNPKITFTEFEERGTRQYRCELTAKLMNGMPLGLSSQHPDGRTAVGSVFLRARRDVTRRRRSLSWPAKVSRRAAPAQPL